MKAIVQTKYGSPDVLQLQEVEKPAPGDNEVRVRIHATTVTAAHTMMRKGTPVIGRVFIGLTKPKHAIPGTEFAGVVDAVGKDVTRFKIGDPVFGATDLAAGCNAEYTCVPEDGVLSTKPTNVSYADAATLLDGTLTSMHFLRDKAHVQPGQQVLINGASGSVGTAAVQIAKYLGAEVTGVCSTQNVELVKSLGADHVIDYTQDDFTQGDQRYDVIFDAVGKSSFGQAKSALTPNGIYLTTVAGLPAMMQTLWTSMGGGKKAMFGAAGLRSAEEKIDDIALLKELVEAGTITPVVDRCYPLAQVAEAHRYVDTGRKRGNVAITVA